MTSPTALPLADPVLAERIAGRLDLVEERLRTAVEYADPLVDDAAHHLANAGGKRLRPLLTLLSAELGGTAGSDDVLDAAVVGELTHLASRYHDDVMDSAPLRRGAPAAHEVWGNNVAILVGDLLFARASSTVAHLGPEAVIIQAGTFERLCLGQLHESTGPGAGDDAVQHYLHVLLLRERAATGADPADAELVARLDGDQSDDAVLAQVLADLRAHDVVRETRERAAALVSEAVDLLAPLPDGPVKDSFVSFADALVDRAS